MAKIARKTLCLFLLCLMSIATLSSCEKGLEIVNIEVGRLPDRIVYMANVDTKLDLSGLTIKRTLGAGYVDEFSTNLWELETYHYISHDIDFTKPGVYEVNAAYKYHNPKGELEINFWVQVIDEGIYAHIRDGTFDEIASPLVYDMGEVP